MSEHRVTVQGYGDDEIPSELWVVCICKGVGEPLDIFVDGGAGWPTPADLWRIEQEHLAAVAPVPRWPGCGRSHGHGDCGRILPDGRTAYCPACMPVFCECATSDPDVMGECRRCHMADLRSPRLADTAERLARALSTGL